MSLVPSKDRRFSIVTIMFVVTFLYVMTGYIGLLVATPPGYATAIWIPSGIALGAVLVWGVRIAPAIFFGSLITNFLTSSYSGITPNVTFPLLIGTLIACGATLQVIFGWLLVKKYLGLDNLLIIPNDILKFLLLTGPLSCVVNTTWSNTILLFLHVIPANAFGLNWLTWWIGDSMGVIIFTPLFLILFAKPREIWRQRIFPILIPLLLSFCAVVMVCSFMHSTELKRIQANFAQRVGNDLLETATDIVNHSNQLSQLNETEIIKSHFPQKRRYHQINIYNITDINRMHEIFYWVNSGNVAPKGKYFFSYQNIYEIGNQKWLVIAIPSEDYVNAIYSWHLSFVLISGFLFCALINIVLFILYGQKTTAQFGMAENVHALKKAESTNLQILRAAGEGIYGLDTSGQITFINPAGAKMLGYEESELIGKRMHELAHHSHPDGSLYFHTECPIYNCFRHDEIHHIEDEVFWRKDGSHFWVEYTATPMRDGKKTVGAVVIFNDVSLRKEIESELQTMAHYDSLTTLPNRASFFQQLATQLEEAKNSGDLLAVCFIDLDDFKHINDTMGHDIGDEALKIITKLLKPVLRQKDHLARIGGDEFAVILSNIKTINDVYAILHRFENALKKPIKLNHVDSKISMSIGVAVYPEGGTTPKELVKNADMAMYHAKEFGKGSYAFYDEELNQKIQRRHKIDSQLQAAFDHKEFILEFQPQIDIQTLQPTGVEVLLRWNTKEFGNVPPPEFIAIAERNGLINKIGEWVLRKACTDYQTIMAKYNDLLLAVNVSVVQLEHPGFLSTLDKILKETHMPKDRLILEITETALIKNPENIIKVMQEIKTLNIRFALDDFGVSYSSLQYLKNLPISSIKIDHGFVKDLSSNVNDVEIVNATIKLAHGMGISTIAEGVEKNEQYLILKELGCDTIQGYLFAKPMRLEVLMESLSMIMKK